MATASIALSPVRRSSLATIAIAGTLLGVVDGLCAIAISAMVFHHYSILRPFQSIASVLLGKSALSGGTSTALIGLAMHFSVAFAWVSVYLIAYRTTPVIRRLASGRFGVARAGALLGATIWFAMNFIVFRTLGVAHSPVTSIPFEVYLVQHILVVGPLIAATVR